LQLDAQKNIFYTDKKDIEKVCNKLNNNQSVQQSTPNETNMAKAKDNIEIIGQEMVISQLDA